MIYLFDTHVEGNTFADGRAWVAVVRKSVFTLAVAAGCATLLPLDPETRGVPTRKPATVIVDSFPGLKRYKSKSVVKILKYNHVYVRTTPLKDRAR